MSVICKVGQVLHGMRVVWVQDSGHCAPTPDVWFGLVKYPSSSCNLMSVQGRHELPCPCCVLFSADGFDICLPQAECKLSCVCKAGYLAFGLPCAQRLIPESCIRLGGSLTGAACKEAQAQCPPYAVQQAVMNYCVTQATNSRGDL